MHFPLRVAGEDDGFVADLDEEIVTGLGDRIAVAGENPLPVPDALQVVIEDTGVRVEGAFQTPSRLLACAQIIQTHTRDSPCRSACLSFGRGSH